LSATPAIAATGIHRKKRRSSTSRASAPAKNARQSGAHAKSRRARAATSTPLRPPVAMGGEVSTRGESGKLAPGVTASQAATKMWSLCPAGPFVIRRAPAIGFQRQKSSPMSQIVTRFAPSPTGFLHIGGARTALFNWLYAKRLGGKFLLRIEDTDRERSTKAAVEAILDGLAWLGLTWDGEAISQFERADRHREIVERMLASGGAYRCYASQEELEEMRAKARAEGKPMRYDGRWRDRDPSEAPAGVKPVIRLRARQDGETIVDDKVQGKVVFANKELDDLVLLRSDGNPTYMLAVVVDDHDMGVTHIIRGDDHLTNAARQMQIYAALGWDVPTMAHIPLIHGPDGAKLSKRHGALGVDAYRGMGYLPAALRNYLARLGWSQGDREFFSTEELIAAFDLPAIGRSPSRFDFAKLENMNGHYMRATPDDELMAILVDALPYLPGGPAIAAALDEAKRAQLLAALPGLKERAKTLVELVDGAAFLFAQRPLAIDDKAADILARGGRLHLAALLERLKAVEDWSAGRNRSRRARLRRRRRAPSSERSPSRCARRRPAARPRPASSKCWRCSAATRASAASPTRPKSADANCERRRRRARRHPVTSTRHGVRTGVSR
jgi:glutamyl-tRNA synthetase